MAAAQWGRQGKSLTSSLVVERTLLAVPQEEVAVPQVVLQSVSQAVVERLSVLEQHWYHNLPAHSQTYRS